MGLELTWKYGEHADKTNLWQRTLFPSADTKVTSTRDSELYRLLKYVAMLGWWLFQRRQYSRELLDIDAEAIITIPSLLAPRRQPLDYWRLGNFCRRCQLHLEEEGSDDRDLL